jgi:predicted AAA+ superfamily ATPase
MHFAFFKDILYADGEHLIDQQNSIDSNLKRLVEQDLTKWHASPERKPMIIRGARQVGKSYLVRQFAAQKGLTMHEVKLNHHITFANVFASNESDKILQELAFRSF